MGDARTLLTAQLASPSARSLPLAPAAALQELVDGIEAAMLQRLRDKAPAVRAEAAAVLARLAQPDEVIRCRI
jgi:hypothetical protein